MVEVKRATANDDNNNNGKLLSLMVRVYFNPKSKYV